MLLKARHLLPITREPIEDGALRIERGEIAEVGTADEIEPEPGEEVRDLGNSVLMPGMVNAHCHAGMTLLRGYADDLPLEEWLQNRIWPMEGEMEPGDVEAGSRLACAEMLLGGTTAFADMYFHMDRVAAAVEESGIRALLSYGMIDVGKDENEAEAELEEGRRFAEEYDGAAGGRISTALGPHSPETCSADMYDPGEFLMTHVSETEEGATTVVEREDGLLPVQFLDSIDALEGNLLAHGVHLYEEEVDLLESSGASVAHCPSSNAKLGSGVAPLPELLDAGVGVCLGTDGAASNNNLDMLHETRLAALLHKATGHDPTLIPAETALEMATLNGARALGLDSGALEPGRPADVVAVDLSGPHVEPCDDPASALVYSCRADDVTDVYVGGEEVVREGELGTMDLDGVKLEARERAEELKERV